MTTTVSLTSTAPSRKPPNNQVLASTGTLFAGRTRRRVDPSAGPQIRPLHLGIVGKIGRSSRQDASADLQDSREIRNLKRKLDRLLGKQDGQPLPMITTSGFFSLSCNTCPCTSVALIA